MKNSTVIRVIVLGVVAIVSVIALQTYWVMKTWDVKEQEFHERAYIALRNVAHEFGKLNTLPQYDLIDRVSNNYYVVNVNQNINSSNLEYFLRRELEAVGLHECFQYAIHNCASNKMVSGNMVCAATTVDLVPVQAATEELPTSDKYIYYFGVRFPNRGDDILESMIPTLIFSGILILTLIFFSYSIFVILRQKRLSEMQKDFINNMTHEFKTPISTINISANVFLKDPTIANNDRLQRYANIINEQNQRLNNQVEKVLQLAKIEGDQFKLNREVLNINELVKSCLQGVRIKVEEKGGQLNSQLTASASIVSADRLHLNNVLHNLLDNAIKYTNTAPHILVSTQSTATHLTLTIRDNGIGIAKEHQDKIFQKFFRVPTGNRHDVKGFGLGLFYVNNICRAHGWQLQLESMEDEGTSVCIQMPLS
ncbi:MAG: HAMP domain-containing sensor histidine kinase [Bacteroidota bacterium]